MRRRTFLASAAAVPATSVLAGGCAPHAAGLDPRLLEAVVRAVLPSQVVPSQAGRLAGDFQRWLMDYRPGAEAVHGYGTAELASLVPDPTPRWSAQLVALDRAARDTGPSFRRLPVADQRRLIEAAVGQAGATLGPAIEAEHVAVAVLAWYMASSEALDLCYDAEIGRRRCRPLDQNPRRPAGRGEGQAG